jgi:hypothetical protein
VLSPDIKRLPFIFSGSGAAAILKEDTLGKKRASLCTLRKAASGAVLRCRRVRHQALGCCEKGQQGSKIDA